MTAAAQSTTAVDSLNTANGPMPSDPGATQLNHDHLDEHKAKKPAAEETSSSEEETLVLERVGQPPSSAARLKAHSERAEAHSRRSSERVAQAIARRAHPERSVPACPSKAEVVRTLAATASIAGLAGSAGSNALASSTSDLGGASWLGPAEAAGHTPALAPRASCRPARAAPRSVASDTRSAAQAVSSLLAGKPQPCV